MVKRLSYAPHVLHNCCVCGCDITRHMVRTGQFMWYWSDSGSKLFRCGKDMCRNYCEGMIKKGECVSHVAPE